MTGLLLLIGGLALVVIGANWLVDGASSLTIGLTVVALGTSLPELTVNIFAAVQNQPEVAIGKRHTIDRWQGSVMLGLYALYLILQPK
jgi:cation:H+ antiporter